MNFYFEAAKTLDRLDAKEGSIKGVLSTLPEKDRKRTAALVIETLKYKSVLMDVIVASKLLKEERKITSPNLALVLVHDVLLSKNGIQAGAGPIKQAILRHKARLNGEFQKAKIKRGARSNEQLAQAEDARAAKIPRYVRVNTLKCSDDAARKAFLAQGYTLGDPLDASTKSFSPDEHIPHLYLFPPQMQFHDDPLYTSGKIILQDKASCFPAAVLAPPAHADSRVIDATAAPGNKTSHLSALMGNKGKLFAFERDRKRFATLNTMLGRAGCSNVETLNTDFLTVDPSDPRFAQVTHILLDPSCSGSGIVNRLDYLLDTEEENADSQDERLTKLSTFQLMMIKHAMKFPSVQKIVYSTCSVHAVENEHVVMQAINSDEAARGGFALAPRADVLPAWHRRGLPGILADGPADSLVRCSPGHDATNGFFVSCFVRRGASDPSDFGYQIEQQSEDTILGKRKAEEGSPHPEDGLKVGGSSGKKKKKRKKKKSKKDEE
ncbi:S-adenosyl-L-methionine-dependent methyltransferase [Dentipellis sp. KUC8613]|nr:S-adenosyl-L-methionine-dependent methyltransferase [Dentipellis sp. KUC8613]